MDKLNFDILNVLNIFYKSTDIQASFSDIKLNLVTCNSQKQTAYSFSIPGMDEMFSYLSEVFSSSPKNNSFFCTYFLSSNFVSNIVFVIKEHSYIGAFITEPMLIKKLNKKKPELCLEDKKTLESHSLKIPIIDYDKIMPIGNVLYQLSKTLFEKETQQILRGSSINSKTNADRQTDEIHKFSLPSEAKDNFQFSIFIEVAASIKKGDTKSLIRILNKVNAEQFPAHQLRNSSFVRSLKNNYIMLSSIAYYIAVESQACCEKVIDIKDNYISKIEKLENVNHIYNLTKETLISLTNIIAKCYSNAYSRYVRMSMNYIKYHYAEKISLKMLAKYTKLSTSYLSKQIKKETGLSLSDNINKVRVEKSKDLLLNTNISILDIAQRVGYNYQNHFAAIFKKFTGLSPTEFKKKSKKV